MNASCRASAQGSYRHRLCAYCLSPALEMCLFIGVINLKIHCYYFCVKLSLKETENSFSFSHSCVHSPLPQQGALHSQGSPASLSSPSCAEGLLRHFLQDQSDGLDSSALHVWKSPPFFEAAWRVGVFCASTDASLAAGALFPQRGLLSPLPSLLVK